MTESTQLQTTENNNTGVVKMEPPPATSSNSAVASTAASTATTSPSPSATMEQQQQQQQQQQQYALKWNDFQSSILNSFRHLRDEEDFVDVTLACDARSYSAHKVVLSACSPYFRKLLKANPCEHPIVILKDVCADDVENLLSFMYNGEVNVSHEHLSDFLKTAHLLQIRGLADVNGGAHGDALNTNNPKALSESLSNNNLSINLSNKMNFLKNAQNNSSSNNHSGSNLFAPPSLPSATSLTPTNNTLVNSNNSNLNSGHQSNHTPAIQELKASSASPSNHHWDLNDMENNRHQHLTPPPQKRIKSADLFRAQHGISPERLLIEREFPVAGQHALTRERHRDRDRSRETSRDRDRDRERNLEFRESLLGQALENNNGSQHSTQKQHADLASLHAQSAGEDSNSSDTEPSDRGDAQHDGTMDSINGSLDNPRSHSFPSAFLGLQGIPGLLPGPSGIGASDFVSRRTLEMRVRATDPRPCPKCGKIYRSAHTLRTHLEDKHTVCPGYRCVLCGTVAKSRNSLHSHMSRQHRGISTKDLPVLPMPSAFDPELASRLLAKAGVKVSPAELRARASPTNGGSGSGSKLDISQTGDRDLDDSDDDPEDLTTGSSGVYNLSGGNNNGNNDLSRYHESLLSNFSHANTTISRMRNEAAAVAAAAALGQQKDMNSGQIATGNATGQSLLDTYLQFISENPFAGMGMSQEHAAAAALHAAKMAQLNALGHGLDKLPSNFLPPQFDLSKLAGPSTNFAGLGAHNNNSLTIEPAGIKRELPSSLSPSEQNNASSGNHNPDHHTNQENRHDNEAMELDSHNQLPSGNHKDVTTNSDGEQHYSEDESAQNS